MKNLIFCAFLFVGFFTACHPKTNPVSTNPEPVSRSLEAGVLEGWVSIGPRSRTFTPCGSDRPVWLDGPTKELQMEYDAVKPNYSYAPVYVLVEGNLHASRAYPFGQSLTVTQVLQASAEGPANCPVQTPGLITASGNEPAWKIQIDPKKEKITLTTNYGQTVEVLPYCHPQQWGKEWTWFTFNESKKPVTIKMNEKACGDSMSGQKYSAEISVQADDQLYSGCGGEKL
ncbi:MAG: hypothetical protein KDC34_12755 [Saprospiraceae bacterium]|nr:hypothetical protein [Saprospiraceae bacterium]